MSEKEIFEQDLSKEEMEAVAGGKGQNSDDHNCYDDWARYIYVPDFPNCAATVEDGSWCGRNDACTSDAIVYLDMKDCAKAWR